MRKRAGLLSVLAWLLFLAITLSLTSRAEAVTGHNLSGINSGIDTFGQPYWEVDGYRYTRGPLNFDYSVCSLEQDAQCIYQEPPEGPDHWVTDWHWEDNYGTNNSLFTIKWNGENIYTYVSISDTDARGRPYWEKDGYRYTRGPLKKYWPNYASYDYYVCRTPQGIMAPFSPPVSITVPEASTTGWRLVGNSWTKGYTVSWGHSFNGVTYRLEEATNSNFTAGLRTVVSDANFTSVTINDRTPGVTYYYRVRAEKDGEFSSWVYGGNGCTVSEGNGWSTWWSGAFTDYHWSSNFPIDRPVIVRVFYRNGQTWDVYVQNSSFSDGDPYSWEFTINGNTFDYYESGYDWYFNRIDLKLDQP